MAATASSLNHGLLSVRGRLVRRLFYRAWKSYIIRHAQKLIMNIEHEVKEENPFPMPTIILCTYTKLDDFMILMNVFKEHDLVLIAPEELPKHKLIKRLKTFNQILYVKNHKFDFLFIKRFLMSLQNFNRSIVVPPAAGDAFIKDFSFNHANLVRLAMKANVPIQPVIINWSQQNSYSHQKCRVFIGNRLFISPRHPDFKDIFFKKRGARKLAKLMRDEYEEIGLRIMNKFNQLKGQYGTNLS